MVNFERVLRKKSVKKINFFNIECNNIALKSKDESIK